MTTRTHWPASLIVDALALAGEGMRDRQIAAATGLPAATVRTYRRRPPRRAVRLLDDLPTCTRCEGDSHDFAALAPTSYSYLLGVYLGDGCVSDNRSSYQLRISLGTHYPGIIEEASDAILAVRGRVPGRTHAAAGQACVHLISGWKQWACYLPQHGPGRKHERVIELAGWQQEIVDDHPQAFLRGLIHSDGCRTINRFKTRLPSGRIAEYEYPRYFFSNLSLDILALFCATCDQLEIRWTRSNHRNISVSHRHSVARMDEFIGPKM